MKYLKELLAMLKPMGRLSLTKASRSGDGFGINIFDLQPAADVEAINAFCVAKSLTIRAKRFEGKGFSAVTGDANVDLIYVGPPQSADKDDQLLSALVVE